MCRAVIGKIRCSAPLRILCANFNPATGDEPAVLNWEDVRVLFHELGHALHHTLTEVDDCWATGTDNVEWDAIELPSQFMENFMWDWRAIGPVARHVKTQEPMPKELFARALKARQFNSGLFLLRQLRFALYDFYLHTRAQPDFFENFGGSLHANLLFTVAGLGSFSLWF